MTQCHLKKLLKQFSHDKHSACKSKHIFNILCAIFTLGSIIYGILLLFSLYRLDYTLAPHGILFRTVALLFPPLLWIAGTGTCHLDFHRYKDHSRTPTRSFYIPFLKKNPSFCSR